MKNIWLWVPAADAPKWVNVRSWLHTRPPDGCTLTFRDTGADGDGINGAWNRLVEAFLESGSEWLFSCHNDISYLPATLQRLMSWGLPLVGALHFQRQAPHGPMVYRDEIPPGSHQYAIQFDETRNWLLAHPDLWSIKGAAMLDPAPGDSLAPVDFTATGCVLIHRDVLAAMEPPWFVWKYPNGGEDRRFFEAARAAGFPAYVDRSVVAGHGDPPVGAAHWLTWDSVSKYAGSILITKGDQDGD